jgi:thiamine biosynthesis lipoprotein
LAQRFLFVLCLLFLFVCTSAQVKRFSFSAPKMGSPFNLILYHSDSAEAKKIAAGCFSLVDSFVNIFSDYIDSSELNRLTASAGKNIYFPLSPALYDILTKSENAWHRSHGAFDITIGPLVSIWRKSRREKKFPDADSIRTIKKFIGFNNLIIDHEHRTALCKKAGMKLDLGGIAQGYIAQQVINRLRSLSIRIALVDVSGDIAMGDPPPTKDGWTIGVNLPENAVELQEKKLVLKNCTVSTSGDVYQYIEHNGKRYSHIVDPKTGYGVTSQRNVTVIASDATLADWLSTACSILSIKKSKRLAENMKAELLIATMEKGKLVLHSTPGFKNYSR